MCTPLLLRGVKVSAFSVRYILGSSRYKDACEAMLGRLPGSRSVKTFLRSSSQFPPLISRFVFLWLVKILFVLRPNERLAKG